MTGINVLSSFFSHFNPARIVSDTVKWNAKERKKMTDDLDEIVEQLQSKGVLTREERTELVSNRGRIIIRLIYDDPGCITNKRFDEWIRESGLYDVGYSQNENRSNNTARLNRLFETNEEKFILTSRGNRKVTYLMDSFMAVRYDIENFQRRQFRHCKTQSRPNDYEVEGGSNHPQT